ncbi:DegT/DnrJ/EryC1/StrS family aminotransferase [Sporichthya sp.]|uniref:DegT/DnrJ/EryC1/StrS family aminotransferase n=1 Tax=Sporichthya sp. TaxID=65475 RepID=UPI00181BA25F|nr:DegT/DnrJ/EryC1/StrS family aminotransferase [Sporichthya sp.]MBA3744834.1 DegT/DnrJ/EryC1/StrS family aminotransferase [Sporichthya sp.]
MTAPLVRPVPTADPTRLAEAERAAVRAAVEAVLTTGPLIGGPFVAAFEDAFAAYLGSRHCIGVDNGSDALVLALQALGCVAGTEALVPASDGGYAAAAAQAAGLVPVAVDVSPENGLVSVAELERTCSPRVTAVVLTHLHGLAADVKPVVAWARQRGIVVVEDCAQATGARRDGRPVGTFADAAAFSFYPTKNLAAFGDGGAVVTDRADVAEQVRSLRQYGWSESFRITDSRGRNARLDALQAAVLTARLPFLDHNNERRRAIARRYRAVLPPGNLLGPDDDSFVAHHAVVVTPNRDRLREVLATHHVDAAVHYPWLIDEMPGIRLGAPADLPNARAWRDRILSLPCFPTLEETEVDTVVSALAGWQAPVG